MIFPFILAVMVLAPIGAIVISARDHQLMAPSVGALDPPTRASGEAVLRGEPVGWRSLWPLVRVEAWRLVRHPAPYLVMLPLGALSLWSLTSSSVFIYERDDVDLIIYLVPLAWGTLIASNLLTLRSRRWHSDELLATAPTPQRSRTLAHLLATLVMVPVSVALLTIALALGAWTGRAFGSPRPWVLVTAVMIVVGAGCVGVTVARWLPRPGIAWVAVIATVVLQLNFGYVDPRWRWLHFSMYGNESITYPELSADHHLTHTLYVVGGILLVAGVALARDGVDVRVGALLGGAFALMVVTGVVQTRPLSEPESTSIARRLLDPANGQVCVSYGGATLCADPTYAVMLAHWRPPVTGVVRRVPPAALAARPVVVRQRPTIEGRTGLTAEVAARADPTSIWPDDTEVSASNRWALSAPDGSSTPGASELSLAFRTASSVVGLPPDAWWSTPANGSTSWITLPLADVGDEVSIPILGPLVQCAATGDARVVAAIWLAGQSTDGARRNLRTRGGVIAGRGLLDTPITFDAIDNYGALLPSTIPEQGAVPSGADVVAATALLARDDAQVAAVLDSHWSELSSGSRTATDLLSWFGMDAAQALDVVRSTSPAPDPDLHPGDLPKAPAITGPCPASRP